MKYKYIIKNKNGCGWSGKKYFTLVKVNQETKEEEIIHDYDNLQDAVNESDRLNLIEEN